MVLSSTWPGVACSPWQPIRRFGVLFKEGGNGGLTGDDGNARDYSVEKPTWGRLDVRALSVKGGWLAEDRSWEADLNEVALPSAAATDAFAYGNLASVPTGPVASTTQSAVSVCKRLVLRCLAKVTQWRSSELTHAKNGTWNGNPMRRPIHAEGVFLGGA